MIHQLTIWEQPEPSYIDVHHPVILAQFGYLKLNTMRLFLLSLSKWDFYATETVPIRVYFREYIPGYKGGTHYEQGKAAVDEINKKMSRVNIETRNEKGKRIYDSLSIYDRVTYEEGNDYVDLYFGETIQSNLRKLKGRFLTAELQELFSFRSYYTVRLYLIGKMFYPGFDSLELSLVEIRAMLVGETATYEEYKFFKSKIIKPALDAISKTSAKMTIEEKKVGRNVTSLIFRPASPLPKPLAISLIPADLRKELQDLQVNLKKIEQMITAGEIDAEYVRFITNLKRADNKVKKPGGAIYTAIIKKELLKEYKKPKPPALTPIKPAPVPEVFRYSEKQIKEFYDTSISKKLGVSFPTFVDVTYYSDGYKDELIEGVWYLIKKG